MQNSRDNQQQEDVVDPELPIIDPHHHLWNGHAGRYMLEELLSDLGSGHNVKATVFMECKSFYRADGPEELRSIGEVEFANGIAAMAASGQYGATRFCAGIVGFADLLRGSRVQPVLEGLIAAGNGRFRGIRHIAACDPEVKLQAPAGMLRDERFREGYACLGKYGLTFDAWLYHPQLEELLPLARDFPEIPVVINHAGGLIGMGSYAGRPEQSFAEWRRGLQQLAELPNTHIKLGGFFMPVFGLGFEQAPNIRSANLAAAAKPIIETCVELFGTDRCMFESNFPVTRNFISYRQIWNCYKLAISDYSGTDKANILHDTAKKFYGIAEK
jgi:predicted TIM-barrel fold metal-dependent hydrolase